MTHDEVYPRLAELAGLHTTTGDEGSLRAHVGSCDVCRQRLETLQRLERQLGELGSDAQASAVLAARLSEIPSVHPRGAASSPPRRQRFRVAVAVASVAVGIGGVFVAQRSGDAPEPRNLAFTATASPLRGSIRIDRPRPGNVSVRLTASGMSHGEMYTLWMIRPGQHLAAASFEGDEGGACTITGAAPDRRWTEVMITRAGKPATAANAVATVEI